MGILTIQFGRRRSKRDKVEQTPVLRFSPIEVSGYEHRQRVYGMRYGRSENPVGAYKAVSVTACFALPLPSVVAARRSMQCVSASQRDSSIHSVSTPTPLASRGASRILMANKSTLLLLSPMDDATICALGISRLLRTS